MVPSSWIHLDSAIRDYVLIPIFLVVILTSVLRSNLNRIFGQAKQTKPPELGELRFLSLFSRVNFFKANMNILSPESFANKKAMYINKNDKKKGLLLAEAPQQLSAMEKMMQQNQDPSAALGMVKNQFMFLGVHGTLGYWVSHLFSGFLVAKTPFPLTFKIKGMLQRGVDVAALDTSYVSSLSWYFFIMISSSGLLQLWSYLTGGYEDNLNDSGDTGNSEMIMMASGGMMGNPMAPGGPQIDIAKTLETERENVQVLSHEFSLQHAERELLENVWNSRD